MDLTKWIPLWERCPELRPEDLKEHHFRDGSVMWTHGRIADGIHITVPWIPDDVVAALIRDRSVWWLANKFIYVGPSWSAGWQAVQRTATATNEVTDHLPRTPDEALYLACCKVLSIDP